MNAHYGLGGHIGIGSNGASGRLRKSETKVRGYDEERFGIWSFWSELG